MNRIGIGILILVCVAGGFFLFTRSDGEKEVFKIGIIAPLTGFLAEYGEEIRRGVLDASGAGVEFVFEDDACDSPKALSAFQKLTDIDRVHFVIGPGCGSPQEVLAPLLKGKDTLLLVPSAASRELYAKSGGNFYNVQYALEDESAFLAKRMYELGYGKVALIHYANSFSEVHAASFRKNFKGEIVADILVSDEKSDLSTELLKIRESNPTAIFSTDVSFFFAQGMRKARTLGITVPVFSQYAVELPFVRPLVEGVIYSFPAQIGEEGAIYELSRQAAEMLIPLVKKCEGKYGCVKRELEKRGVFDEEGIQKREMMLKRIEKGEAILYVSR